MSLDNSPYVVQTFTTETGAQVAVAVARDKKHRVVIVSGTTSDNNDLEYTLDNPRISGAKWHKLATNVNGSAVLYQVTIDFPCQGLRLNRVSDSSHATYMEVLQGLN